MITNNTEYTQSVITEAEESNKDLRASLISEITQFFGDDPDDLAEELEEYTTERLIKILNRQTRV